MSNIFLTYDLGNYAIINGKACRKIGSSNIKPNQQISSIDYSGITEQTFNYDDQDVENGDFHRTWSPEEMTIARLPQHCSNPTLEDKINSDWRNFVEIYTIPTDGIFRVAAGYDGGEVYINRELKYSFGNTQPTVSALRAIPVKKGDIFGLKGYRYIFILLPYKYPYSEVS